MCRRGEMRSHLNDESFLGGSGDGVLQEVNVQKF